MSNKDSFWATLTLSENPDRVIIGELPVNKNNPPETGKDRLRKMFSLDQYGNQSKEFTFLTQVCFCSTLGGAVVGSVLQSRNAFINFMENNQATKFQNHMEAKRSLQRVMYLAFSKGAWQLGWRIGLFTTSFASVTTMVSIYRGKESITEYVVAGGMTGGLWKMGLGPKGMFSGGLAGAVLGGIAGAASQLVLKIGGVSMDDIRSFSETLKNLRSDAMKRKTMEAVLDDDKNLSSKKDVDDSFLNTLDVDEGAIQST